MTAMNIKTLFKLIEKSNLPPEAKSRLRGRLQEALDNYMIGKISQDALTGIVTDILRQLDVDMSMPVRRMRRVEDEPVPDDEIPPDDQVVEVKDEVIEDDYYVGGRRVRRSWMNWRT